MAIHRLTLRYTDAHCHLTDLRFGGDELKRVLERSRLEGVSAWALGGVDPSDWERQALLKAQMPESIFTSYGLHPWWVAAAEPAELTVGMQRLAARLHEADGLGELGLDYGPRLERQLLQQRPVADSSQLAGKLTAIKRKQLSTFEWQLDLLKTCPKPVVLHIVRAHEDAVRILTANGPLPRGGIVHSFSGSREIAQKYLDLGLGLSISGGITGKGFETLKRAVSYIPLDQLLVETDSPDQPLAGQTSGLNEPSSLIEIAKAISMLRQKSGGESAEQILEASSRNVARIFSRP